MSKGIKRSEVSDFLVCSLTVIQSNWLHFEKKGWAILNIDRMIQKFGFITEDEIHF